MENMNPGFVEPDISLRKCVQLERLRRGREQFEPACFRFGLTKGLLRARQNRLLPCPARNTVAVTCLLMRFLQHSLTFVSPPPQVVVFGPGTISLSVLVGGFHNNTSND